MERHYVFYHSAGFTVRKYYTFPFSWRQLGSESKHLSVVNDGITSLCDSAGCQPCTKTNFCVRVQNVSLVTTLICVSKCRMSALQNTDLCTRVHDLSPALTLNTCVRVQDGSSAPALICVSKCMMSALQNTDLCTRVHDLSPAPTLISVSEYRMAALHQH